MKTLICLLLSLFLVYSCQEKMSDKESVKAIMEKHWKPYISDFNNDDIGVAIIAKKSSDKEFYEIFGFQNDFSKQQRFRSASITKTFTAAAILKLHDEGSLDITDTISNNIPGMSEKYLPVFDGMSIPNYDKITIKQLLAHRAGVFDVTNLVIPDSIDVPYAGESYVDYQNDQENGRHTFTKDELVSVVVKNQLSLFEPGAKFHYSNTGYGILGIIIERVSGLSLNEYLEQNFLQPLAMKNTAFAITPDLRFIENDNDHYTYTSDTLLPNLYDNISSAQAEGNLMTTMEDLLIWCQHLYSPGALLSESSYELMVDVMETEEALLLYGLGCEGHPEDLGYGHTGARVGTLVIMRHDPQADVSMIIKSNVLDFNSMERFVAENELLFDIMRDVKEVVK